MSSILAQNCRRLTLKDKSPKKGQKIIEKDKEVPERKMRSEPEIIADEIKMLKDEGRNPLAEALQTMDAGPAEERDKYSTGLLLFLHGSPGEESQSLQLAYILGRKLDLPVINLDNCFITALCFSQCPAKTIIMTSLNDNFDAMRKACLRDPSFTETPTQNDLTGSPGFKIYDYEDEFDIVQKKIYFYALNKYSATTPRSKTSDKKKPSASLGSSTHMGPSISLFQLDIIEELLKDYLSQERFNKGFILDSLTSTIVKNPATVLTTIIKCKDSICNLHLILCHSDFAKWARAYEENLRAEELLEEETFKVKPYTPEEIDKIVQNIEDMDADEYEHADPELKAIYIQVGLETRRNKYIEKYGITPGSNSKDRLMLRGAFSSLGPAESRRKITKKDEGRVKIGTEYSTMQARYTEYYKTTMDSLIQIACNWLVETADLGFPLVTMSGQLANALPKKTRKKSEIHLVPSVIEIVEKGFPLTLLSCPCVKYAKAIEEMFLKCDPFLSKPKKGDPFNILQYPARRKDYTVFLPNTLPTIQEVEPLQWLFLKEHPIKKCECNQITDLNLIDDTTQDNVLNILSKWHCICGKTMTSSQTSTSEVPSSTSDKTESSGEAEEEHLYPLPLHAVKSTDNPKQRIILQPGDLVRCKYAFKPKFEGNFAIKRFVEVSGWPKSRKDISVTGTCDLPRIDSRPKKLFASFVRKTEDDEVYKLTFLDDLKMFEFGPIFIGRNRIYEEEYTIDLRNASLLTCDIYIGFMDYDDVYKIDKNFITLEPEAREKLTILAAPSSIGDHETVLLFCIKDNPEIVKIKIMCHGVVPLVEVLPITKIIDFGKLLLYRREDDRFIVKNDSILPIKWIIRNPKDFEQDFIVSKTFGIVPRNDNQVVPVTYTACNVGVITQQSLIIDIYDELGRGDPMLVDAIYLSAECYDVMVECAFENPSEMFLNFGNVKVNSTIYRDMFLLNRGKYNIYYKLKKVKDFPEPSLLKTFNASPECSIIPPTLKLTSVEFECTPTTKINLNNVPAYTCSLLDSSKEQVVVAKFPVCITIASFYNTFTLFPLGEINFHIIAVGEGVLRDVILTNTSKCPFNYEIILPEKYRNEAEALPPQKAKDTKLKVPPLKCGNFFIVNDDNLLAPGESKVIPIQFLATAARRFEETVHFVISDTCPAEAGGVPLKLVGTGALPSLDFWNLENTFREHLIVKCTDDFKTKESTPHCIFAEDTVTLHFLCVTVNTRYTGSIDLYNNGLVPCIIHSVLHYQSNTNSEIFSLNKTDVDIHIDAFQHRRLPISFTPKALEEYRAVLEVKLKMWNNETASFNLCLIGEGVIPRIVLLSPKVRQHRLALMQFPVTCLGSISKKNIKFQNISYVKSVVHFMVIQIQEERPVFWITNDEGQEKLHFTVTLRPNQIESLQCCFNPLVNGRTSCDINVRIDDNPYEYYTILCEAEAFVEDVILMGLEMLSLETEMEDPERSPSNQSQVIENRKKSRSAGTDRSKTKDIKKILPVGPDGEPMIPALLKYLLDFGGCELLSAQKRSVVMMNNSEKAYKFVWEEVENIVVKPTVGYISPGEEKDLEITFFSVKPVCLKKEMLTCNLVAIDNESLTLDATRGATWDSRQIVTVFQQNMECVNERVEAPIEEREVQGEIIRYIDIIILYSATTEYTKYLCDLAEDIKFGDTYIFQKRDMNCQLKNVGTVPLKVTWKFSLDDEFPSRLDKYMIDKQAGPPETITDPSDDSGASANRVDDKSLLPESTERTSKTTLFSGSLERQSVDTWFEASLPFTIAPNRACLKPGESQSFKITFSPQEAFEYRVRLKSTIDNLDPYDQNVSSKIVAKSLVPYIHLDLEESNYLEERKSTGIVLPPFMNVLEFRVLGSGCYKKSFQIINPTSEGYEYIIESVVPAISDRKMTIKDFILTHCDKLKGFVEGGTSDTVTFTFAPTEPGVFESQWRIIISKHNVTVPLMVVGFVREPEVEIIPTILTITHSLVGFTSTNIVNLKNHENEDLNFEYKGHTLYDETGSTPIVVRPEKGELRGQTEARVSIYYTPITDGPISFKIFFQIQHMSKPMTLMVNALSFWVKPRVTYYIIGNEHALDHDLVTNIHLEQLHDIKSKIYQNTLLQIINCGATGTKMIGSIYTTAAVNGLNEQQTASTYERQVPFKIKNDGSITFRYTWDYVVTPVKKYLTVSVEPRTGYVPPGEEVQCILHFHLRTVPVQAYPVTLSISDGPNYQIYLYAEIEKPRYHFNLKEFDFGKCIIGAPEYTYKKNLAFTNDDTVPVLIDLETNSCSELFIDYRIDPNVESNQRVKIPVYFRPRNMEKYEFKLRFWVNSLCEELIIITGEGVPLLLDVYEGCHKTCDLGPVKVGDKIVREIDVMNYSKVMVEPQFFFEAFHNTDDDNIDEIASEGTSLCLNPSTGPVGNQSGPSRVQNVKMYRQEKTEAQIEKDVENALASLKVIPAKCVIYPHRKVSLKILFRPVGLIHCLNVQLNAKVLNIIRPLVLLSGSATGMSLRFSQDSLQFGKVRKRGCKILKVMLENNGDFGARFWWQPLVSNDFTIVPMQGHVAAHSNVTFNIRYTPFEYNPFVKEWANCNIENYRCLDLALYAACVDEGLPQTKSILIECQAREVATDYISITNPTDENWLVLSELTGAPCFETPREFYINSNTTYDIPLHFKPKTMGQHLATVLYAPLGESAMYVELVGVALAPKPNDILNVTIEAKKTLSLPLVCKNITEKPETYMLRTELVKMVPDKFDGYYEIKYPDKVKCWGEAAATCIWNFICFEPCDMYLKVVFIHENTNEFQFYEIIVTVTPSQIIGTLKFSCRARESVQQEVVIHNSLDEEAEFTINCDKLQCVKVVKVGKHADAKIIMTYSPIVVGEFEDYLTIENYLVGTYTYRAEGVCKPAKEKYLELSTPLGTCIPVRLRISNFTDYLANFQTTISHPSVFGEKEYNVAANDKGKLLLWFEPTQLGVQNIRVSFDSSVAGEFVYNIKGNALKPPPQGPYEITSGSSIVIKFKNVFEELRTFRIAVDRDEFYVKSPIEEIKSKKEIRVVVYLREMPVGGWRPAPPSGCLLIEPLEPPEPKVHWIYFLKGSP